MGSRPGHLFVVFRAARRGLVGWNLRSISSVRGLGSVGLRGDVGGGGGLVGPVENGLVVRGAGIWRSWMGGGVLESSI